MCMKGGVGAAGGGGIYPEAHGEREREREGEREREREREGEILEDTQEGRTTGAEEEAREDWEWLLEEEALEEG